MAPRFGGIKDQEKDRVFAAAIEQAAKLVENLATACVPSGKLPAQIRGLWPTANGIEPVIRLSKLSRTLSELRAVQNCVRPPRACYVIAKSNGMIRSRPPGSEAVPEWN